MLKSKGPVTAATGPFSLGEGSDVVGDGEGAQCEEDRGDPPGAPIDTDDLTTLSPYITHAIRRFGDWVLDLSPPEAMPVTTLDLAPGALSPGDITSAAATAVARKHRV